ncbi:imelysin family protein [Microbulbifer sp. 2205BS26-8]|uniref:imelysin family protein n=1 Tax=Microbulbifer sp. 2205BS26-8 TaxID=3064386 RepID=UPI00273E8AF3|nr:imelysin family protein [Microbulbifer sp. 2205BS26-8]MDP5210356.1 imelysin family protein [Microbulbifer sp. 2205BS26-8]
MNDTIRQTACALLLASLGALLGCEQKPATPPESAQGAALVPISEKAASDLSLAIWQAGQAQVMHTRATAATLRHAVAALLEHPSEDRLEKARLAWLDAHREFAAMLPYIQLAFSPVALRSQGRELLLTLDSWPAHAGYLDTVPGYSDSGIVNDTAIELTLANLRKQHRLTAHEEASIGFHALEVMLWGPTSERMAEQFVADSRGEKPEALAANRRRTLTRLIAQGIEEDMDGLARSWPSTANHLSRRYLALGPVARLQQIRAAHTQVIDELLLPRLPEGSDSDVESSRAADSKQALLAAMATLQSNWIPTGGSGLAELLLDRHQVSALEQTFADLEALLLEMEDPFELAELGQLAKARKLLEKVAGLMAGTTQIPVSEMDVMPVVLPVE